MAPGQELKIRVYDADHERRRKEQLDKLFNRTQEQVGCCSRFSHLPWHNSLECLDGNINGDDLLSD